MSDSEMSAPSPVDQLAAVAPPLHMPVGSVRALITLSVLGTVWSQVLRGQPTGPVFHDTLLLVLGYYFGHRGAKAPAVDAITAQPTAKKDPLWLPRGSIRLLIVLGFAWVAWKLHQQGSLFAASGPPPILVLVATFIGGGVMKGALGWGERLISAPILSAIGHTLALTTLTIVFGYCGVVVAGVQASLPEFADGLFLGVVGFYLGKR
jgi:hypothetical protein